jgi:hypothetical protein
LSVIGDYQITGKHGHVMADHPGYLLDVRGTVQRWKKAEIAITGRDGKGRSAFDHLRVRCSSRPATPMPGRER